MSSKLRPSFGAFYCAFVISIGFLSIRSSSAADRDDHSYLPPWMLNETGAVRKVDEKAGPPRAPLVKDPPRALLVKEVPPAKAEVPPVKTIEPDSTDLTAKATLAKTKVVGFVSSLFKSSIRFATGD